MKILIWGGFIEFYSITFFSGLYDLYDQGNNRSLDGIQKLLVENPSRTLMDTGSAWKLTC